MELYVGIDAAKDVHWACAIDLNTWPVLSQAVTNNSEDIDVLLAELRLVEAEAVTVALDLLGDAALRHAGRSRLPDRSQPGLAIKSRPAGMRGGENKPDFSNTATIADLARTRTDLRAVEIETETDVDIRLPVGRRREVVVGQTSRRTRLSRRHSDEGAAHGPYLAGNACPASGQPDR